MQDACVHGEVIPLRLDDRPLDENPIIHGILREVRWLLHRGLDFPKQFGRLTLDVAIADSKVKSIEPVYIPHFNSGDMERRNDLTRHLQAG